MNHMAVPEQEKEKSQMSNSNNLHFLFVLEACFQKSCKDVFENWEFVLANYESNHMAVPKSGGYRNQKKWTCQTCLTGFGREAENWTFLSFQSRHVMTRCKNGHVFHPTPFYTAQHGTTQHTF
jgi:hypothetical protein